MMMYILNGPATLIICIIGMLLNGLTIYILSTVVFSRKFVTITPYNKSSANIYETVDGTCSPRPRLISPANMKKVRRSRIFVYLLWLMYCDIVLLACSVFKFSIPILINDYGSNYMKTIPFW